MQIWVPEIFDIQTMYVEDMTEHHQLDETMEGLVRFGAPVVAANSTLLAATAILALATYTPPAPILIDPNFGRTINVTGSAAGTVTIHGRDYLNQAMSQLVTLATNTVLTLKAFKYVDRIVSGTFVGNVSLGPGTKLGFPFVVSEILYETADGIAAGDPTLTVPVATTPTTATGDIRGTVVPATTMNGTAVISMTVRFNPLALGGLYGQKQA